MTTPAAAGRSMPRRLFLARVVPVWYVLALMMAAVLARASMSPAEPTKTETLQPVSSRVKPVSKVHHHAHRVARPVRHHVTRPRLEPPAPRPVVAAPKRVESVVSRSDDRRQTPPPAVSLVITIASIASPATMQSAINDCLGPVEIDWGYFPTEIAEHDFCGGSAFSSLSTGQRVRVVGGGMPGVYVVNGQRRFAAAGSSADQLNGMGDIVLQTCVSDGVILVGLDRVS